VLELTTQRRRSEPALQSVEHHSISKANTAAGMAPASKVA
jgi:hypothetical protein